MTKNFPHVKAQTLQLALHLWADWLGSLEAARKELGGQTDLSSEEGWRHWNERLDQESVWSLALSTMDRLELPRLFAGYWIACLVSPHGMGDDADLWKIRWPGWVIGRMIILRDTLLCQEPPFGNRFRGANMYSSRSDIGHLGERALPPSYISVAVPDPPSFVTIHVPHFLIPGLVADPSSLVEVLRMVDNEHGKHPLSALLQCVGRPSGGDWAKEWILQVREDQLRPLYKYLLQLEYDCELVKAATLEEPKDVAGSSGEGAGDVPVPGHHAKRLVRKEERMKIGWRVRKRVIGWFKAVGRWPLPKNDKVG